MKSSLLCCLLGLLFVALSHADQSIAYPKKKPLVELTLPDDWEVQTKKGVLYANPADDANLFITLSGLEAGSDDPEGAVKEVQADIEESFTDVKYEEVQKGGTGGTDLTVFNAKGRDEDGEANINVAIVGRAGEKKLTLLKCISSQEAFEAHGEMVSKIISAIKAHGLPTVQTYRYPDKEAPAFAIDFPADWKLEATDEGAYVLSPDELVAMNVLFIDQADVAVAVESMKTKVGAKYESVEWNGGGEPNVAKDDALGVTATFHNGVAVDGNGVKYSVNFAQYVRKDGDKFLLLLSQNPLAALEKHGDAIEKILQSIQVK